MGKVKELSKYIQDKIVYLHKTGMDYKNLHWQTLLLRAETGLQGEGF